MALPSQSVDAIFAKLSIAYGHRFLSVWDGFPMETVKADWAQTLDGLPDDAIMYGLVNLPAGRPPDAMEFRMICRRRPEPTRQQALPDMTPRKIPEVLREQIASILTRHKQRQGEPERVRWARNYADRFGGEGQRLTFNQKQTLATARRILELHNRDQHLQEAKAEAQRKTDAAMAGEASHAEQ